MDTNVTITLHSADLSKAELLDAIELLEIVPQLKSVADISVNVN